MTKSTHEMSSQGPHGERRQSTRYVLRGPAWFQWKASDGRWCEGSGISRDIGKEGTFIESSEIPPVATHLKVIVTFSMGVTNDVQIRLSGAGDVRHVQLDGPGVSGFGAWVAFRTETAG